MFDLGFSELLLIAVVALIVLGPERLPKAARFAGLWVRRARAQWYSVKSELERELAAEELKRSLDDTRATMHEIEASVRDADAEARREFESMRSAATGDAQMTGPAVPASGPQETPAAESTPPPDPAPIAEDVPDDDAARRA